VIDLIKYTESRIVTLSLLLLSLILAIPVHAESPDVSLVDLDGKQHNLSEYIGNGKWVFFNIWGPRCPPCVEEMPDLQDFHDAHKDKDAIVVGMALDYPSFGYANIEEVREFVDDYFITFPILLGDGRTIESLGGGMLQGTPTTLVFDPTGKLFTKQVGALNRNVLEQFMADQKKE